MRRSHFALGAIGLVLVLATARGDDLPALKHGQWEFKRVVNRSDQPGKPETLSFQRCTDPGADMQRQQETLAKSGCSTTPPEKSADRYSFTWKCSLPNGGSGSGRTELTFDGDSAYRATIESEGERAGKSMKTSEALTAKRIGDCQRSSSP